jgi:K(+)-stimulated pyrophosphate-energized sodium pump
MREVLQKCVNYQRKCGKRLIFLTLWGNTIAATGKGFAIASAALTSLASSAAVVGIAKIDGTDIYCADVLAGLFAGAMIPFIFSSLAIRVVGETAMAIVEEVRRQFRTIPGISLPLSIFKMVELSSTEQHH